MGSKNHEQWKKYFESQKCSIYEIIYNAIRVAALDDPKKFKLRRKQIVEKLYSCQFTGCFCADKTELDVERTITETAKDCKKRGTEVGEHGQIISLNEISKFSISETQALGDKIEDDFENIRNVLEIKEQLENTEEQTETEIYESLRRLQLMVVSVDVLEVTKIGSTIRDLQHHWSRQIAQLARSIADDWKTMIEEWVDAAAETAERSKNPEPDTVLEEWRGLPPPSMDEILLVSQSPMEFSEKFFDGMDDGDQSPDNGNGIEEIHENKTELKLQLGEGSACRRQKAKQESIEKLVNSMTNFPRGNKRELELQLIEDAEHVSMIKRQKARRPNTECTSEIYRKPRLKKEVENDMDIGNKKDKQQRALQSPNAVLKRPSRPSDDTAMVDKLQTSKKKLRAGYQAHEKARRNIQLITELRDVPKHASGRRSSRSNFRIQTRRR